MSRLSTSILVFIFITAFTGCLTIRPGAVKSGKNLYITYGIENSTIYFIKPLDLFQQKTKGSASLDFTFKYSNVTDDTTSIKISIFDQEVIKQVDSVKIEGENNFIISHSVRHMFSDRAYKQYVNRFEILVPLFLTKNLFDAQHWKLTVFNNGMSKVYLSSNNTDKNIKRLKKNIFNVL